MLIKLRKVLVGSCGWGAGYGNYIYKNVKIELEGKTGSCKILKI